MILKPWYLWRPTQIVRRLAARTTTPAAGFAQLPVSWGARLKVDASKSIGQAIRTTGLYDLAVSETILRLLNKGDVGVDVGANIGYMTVLMALAVGPRGRVVAWEPHPQLYPILRDNVESAGAAAWVELHHAAAGRVEGTADLVVPDGYTGNDGLSHLASAGDMDGERIRVPVETIDDTLDGEQIAVMKLDVEGFEGEVLGGCARAIEARRIRHVIFEDHLEGRGEASRALASWGYRLLSIGWSTWRPMIQAAEAGSLASSYEAPSYLATLDSAACELAFKAPGWRALGRVTAR